MHILHFHFSLSMPSLIFILITLNFDLKVLRLSLEEKKKTLSLKNYAATLKV